MVVFAIAMPKGIGADGKGQEYHEIFECCVLNQLYPEYGKTGHHQRQEGAMNGTGQ